MTRSAFEKLDPGGNIDEFISGKRAPFISIYQHGHTNRYQRSMHIDNFKRKEVLNIFWSDDLSVTVELNKYGEKDRGYQYKLLYRGGGLTQQMLDGFIEQLKTDVSL